MGKKTEVEVTLEGIWDLIGSLLCAYLCITLVLQFPKSLWTAARILVGPLSRCVHFLSCSLGRFMPLATRLTHLEQSVDVLRQRVTLLGNLWRERGTRICDQATGVIAGSGPAAKNSQWDLILSFLAGLCCGWIASLLALCLGVFLGHSL